ncbi:MAG: prepilin-type N-terminal cleavage/methylation domain-containing protein [Evtepia sp.]
MNHKGFTLIELMVCLAIMSLGISMAALSFGNISAAQANQTIDEISSALSRCRIDTMSRGGEVKLELYMEGKTAYCKLITNGVSHLTKLSSRVSIQYTLVGDTTVYDVAKDPLTLSYARDTGAFHPPGCTGITVIGGRSSYHLVLVPSTGGQYRA